MPAFGGSAAQQGRGNAYKKDMHLGHLGEVKINTRRVAEAE